MSLKLILGPSGSGKSRLLFERVLEHAAADPRKKYIVLVPEQFTLQTQQELCRLSRNGGVWNIDILSFSRLAQRVFEQTGVPERTLLKETGKSLILRHIASQQTSGLPLLSGIVDRPGCLDELKSILSELQQYEVGEEQLRAAEQSCAGHPALQEKLRQIGSLRESYVHFMEDHYITAEEVPAALCRKAPEAAMLRGCEIFLDGYTGFTPAQLDVLAVLMKLSSRVTVTVAADPRVNLLAPAREGELFAMSKATCQALTAIAGENGIAVEEPDILTGEQGRFAGGGMLAYLERNLMRPGKRVPYPAGGSSESSIRIQSGASPYEEVERAAALIRTLAMQGIRYREIAVVVGDLGVYSEYVRRVFRLKNIPFFIDQSVPVVLNPAFEFVQDALNVVEKNFSCESVMAFLRTGLVMEESLADETENYLIAAGIRGRKAWAETWQRRTVTFDEAKVAELDGVRARLWELLGPFAESMKNSSAPLETYARALWTLMDACGVPRKLSRAARTYEQAKDLTKAAEYENACAVIADVLDEAVMLLGRETVKRTQFAQILQAGLAQARIGILPPGTDEVHIGDMTRSRWDRIRVLIFLGMNDEYVPPKKPDGGLLTDMEREILSSHDLKLAPTRREEAAISRFYLYLCLTKPSRMLVLSYARSDASGGALRPSSELLRIRELFPCLKVSGSEPGGRSSLIWSGEDAFRELATMLARWRGAPEEKRAEMKPSILELIRFCSGQDRRRTERLLGKQESAPEIFLAKEAAERLYGGVLQGSVSRLESFFLCPYQQYARYGLQLQEREKFEADSQGIGNLMHAAAERLSVRVRESRYDWRTLPDDVRDRWTDECLQEEAQRLMPGLFQDSSRSEGQLQRLRHQLRATVFAMQKQIRAGTLSPALFEVRFDSDDGVTARPLVFSGGGTMRIAGRIDRIDEGINSGSGRVYIRVIDYKTGARSFDMNEVLAGTQLQLIVYMDAAERIERRRYPDRPVVCAGILYDRFQYPVLDAKNYGKSEEELSLEMLKAMRLEGLLNRDEEALLSIASDRKTARYIAPVDYKKDGSLKESSSNTATSEQLEDVKAFVQRKMQEGGERILSGEIAPRPVWKNEEENACRFCSVRECCPFDGSDPAAQTAQIPHMAQDEAFALIRRGEEGESGSAEGED